ncbi:MAG: hypothetical protein QXQ57_06480 [Sulfolobales archaeon]
MLIVTHHLAIVLASKIISISNIPALKDEAFSCKELSERLIEYVVNHRNKWLRNMFRHYIHIEPIRRLRYPAQRYILGG